MYVALSGASSTVSDARPCTQADRTCGSLGKHFDAGHCCVSLDGDKAQEELALGVGFEAGGSADDDVGLVRLFGKIEVLKEHLAVAKHIEDVGDRRLAILDGRRPVSPTRRKMKRQRI